MLIKYFLLNCSVILFAGAVAERCKYTQIQCFDKFDGNAINMPGKFIDCDFPHEIWYQFLITIY